MARASRAGSESEEPAAMEPQAMPITADAERGGRPRAPPRSRDCWWQLISLMCLLALGTVSTLLVLAQRQIQKGAKDLHGHTPSAGTYPLTMKHRASSPEKPAAHLEGINGTTSVESPEWLDKIGHAFTRGHLQLHNNSLVIPAKGFYFVYTQVVFNGGKCPSNGALYLSHTIFRLSKNYPRRTSLVSAQKSVCTGAAPPHGEKSSNAWFRSIYQGAVFQLEKADQLFTETDGLQHVAFSHGKTFFGAFAV
ncbi:lymphotoxin-alpha-like [Ambystoma mexicanum]|uniref:lymphotoxin-alpha-like n=1 Tax=Ambystoma mexicanum TaxID=8296 RepID=UPI0037E9604D